MAYRRDIVLRFTAMPSPATHAIWTQFKLLAFRWFFALGTSTVDNGNLKAGEPVYETLTVHLIYGVYDML